VMPVPADASHAMPQAAPHAAPAAKPVHARAAAKRAPLLTSAEPPL